MASAVAGEGTERGIAERSVDEWVRRPHLTRAAGLCRTDVQQGSLRGRSLGGEELPGGVHGRVRTGLQA